MTNRNLRRSSVPPSTLDDEYRRQLRRLLQLSALSPGEERRPIRCVFEPSFHPEWCVAVKANEDVAKVTVLDRSAWAWFNSRQPHSGVDPLKGWVEPGRWMENVRLESALAGSIRRAFPPSPEAGTSIALDGMSVGFEMPAGGGLEWRYFHSAVRSDGLALARTIAAAIRDGAGNAHVREAAAAAIGYLRTE